MEEQRMGVAPTLILGGDQVELPVGQVGLAHLYIRQFVE